LPAAMAAAFSAVAAMRARAAAGLRNPILPMRKTSLCLLVAIILLAFSTLEVKPLLHSLILTAQEWKVEQPLATAVFSVLLVVAWILSFLPLTALEVSIGFLFGVRVGYIVVYLGKVIGCMLSFVLGRTVAHDWAQRQFGKHELLRAVDLAVAREPYKFCFIVRLAYIPIALKNFGLAVLSVEAQVFMASLVSVELFNSAVLVTVGSTAKDLGDLISGRQPKSTEQVAVMLTGCAFLIGLLVYLTGLTQRALREVRENKVVEQAAHAKER